MSREISPRIVLLQTALAIAVAAPAIVFAEKDPPGVPSTTKEGTTPEKTPSGITSTAKDAPPPGTEPSENTENQTEAAKTRFEAANGFEMNIREDGSIVIQDIKEQTAAARSGLKAGDQIVEIDGQVLKSRAATERLLEDTSAKPYRVVKLLRGGETIEVALGRRIDLLGMLVVPDSGLRPVVRRVEQNSPAEKAGIHPDDIITAVGDRKVETFKQFNDYFIPVLSKAKGGDEIYLRVMRDTEEFETAVVRTDDLKLPLPLAPERPLPSATIPPAKVVEVHDADDAYLNELALLVTPYAATVSPPFVAYDAHFEGTFPVLPTPNAVAAVLLSPGPAVVAQAGKTVVRKREVVAAPPPSELPPDVIGTSPLGTIQDPALPPSFTPLTRAEFLRRRDAQRAAKSVGVVETERVEVGAPAVVSIRRNGFVIVDSNAGVPTLRARIAGFPPGTYSLVVTEFGDFGDVVQNSQGAVVAVLATFHVGADGRAEVVQSLHHAALPSALIGRVVTVVPGAYDPATNTFGAGNQTAVTAGPMSTGVFGLASPERFRR